MMNKTIPRLILFDSTSDLAGQLVVFSLLDHLVFKHGHGMANLLLLCLMQQSPAILLSPAAGAGVDRWGARRWMLFMSLVKCAMAGWLLVVSSRAGLLAGYLCFLIAGLFAHIGQLSAVAQWLPPGRLIGFNALNERVGLGLRVGGPVLIGWLVHQTGRSVALGIALILLSLAALVMLGKGPALTPALSLDAVDSPRRRGLFRGLGHLVQPPLNAFLPILAFVLVAGGVLGYGLPVLMKQRFAMGIAGWGVVMAASQAGSFLATLVLPRWHTFSADPGRRLMVCICVSLLFILLPGVSGMLLPCLVVAGAGFGLTLLHICQESLIQRHAPLDVKGGVMAGVTSFRGLCLLAGTGWSAAVAALWGPAVLMGLTGLAIGGAVICLYVRHVNNCNCIGDSI